MFYKILFLFLLALIVSACSTTPKDAAVSSGSGSTEAVAETISESEEDVADGASDPTLTLNEKFIVEVGDRVFFAYDSAELTSDSKELLQDQVAWIKEQDVSVTIEGHCDERGTREYNLALGEKRAHAVRSYLTALGIPPSSVSTVSYGKERPVAVGSHEGAWKQNRRSVTIIN